jgi:GNAT superfamily N-acetyltransferase
MDKGKFFIFKEKPNIKTLLMIIAINKESPWWDKTIVFAKNCPWTPGKRLARRMLQQDFKKWEKVFIAVHGDDVIGFCIFEESGNLPKDFNCSPFINLVFVDENFRGQRISKSLIDAALHYAKELGYKKVYLKSEHIGLYEKYGFQKIADFEPIVGLANQLFEITL